MSVSRGRVALLSAALFAVLLAISHGCYNLKLCREAPLAAEDHVSASIEEETGDEPAEDVPRGRLMILLHTSAATWSTRALAVRETMLATPLPNGVKFYWVSTEELPPNDHPVISTSNRVRPGLPAEPLGAMNERVLQAFSKVLDTERYQPADWYLKMDDDTYVNVSNVLNVIEEFASPATSSHYIGTCSCTFQKGLNWCRAQPEMNRFFRNCSGYTDDSSVLAQKYACGGPGYLLSLGAVRKLVAYEQTVGIPRSYEDLAVGWALTQGVGVSCTSRSGPFLDWGPTAHTYLPDLSQERVLSLAGFHKALPGTMRHLHRCATTGDCKYDSGDWERENRGGRIVTQEGQRVQQEGQKDEEGSEIQEGQRPQKGSETEEGSQDPEGQKAAEGFESREGSQSQKGSNVETVAGDSSGEVEGAAKSSGGGLVQEGTERREGSQSEAGLPVPKDREHQAKSKSDGGELVQQV